jgi:hypothetical protein
VGVKVTRAVAVVVVLAGCHDPAGGSGAPADRGCKPLDGSPQTMAGIEAMIERQKNDKYEGGKKLTKGTCGDYETAHVTNGHAGRTYYLKDGLVVGETYADDNQGRSCNGVIPSCK